MGLSMDALEAFLKLKFNAVVGKRTLQQYRKDDKAGKSEIKMHARDLITGKPKIVTLCTCKVPVDKLTVVKEFDKKKKCFVDVKRKPVKKAKAKGKKRKL